MKRNKESVRDQEELNKANKVNKKKMKEDDVEDVVKNEKDQ